MDETDISWRVDDFVESGIDRTLVEIGRFAAHNDISDEAVAKALALYPDFHAAWRAHWAGGPR